MTTILYLVGMALVGEYEGLFFVGASYPQRIVIGAVGLGMVLYGAISLVLEREPNPYAYTRAAGSDDE